MGEGLLTPLIAHIEGEKSVIESLDGSETEYFYRITLQVNNDEKDKEISYNIELYTDNELQSTIFKEDQKKDGSASHVGTNAFVKYSNNNYDKLCLRSSVGNTCNRFVDISEYAGVEASKSLPDAEDATGTGLGPSSETPANDPTNDW